MCLMLVRNMVLVLQKSKQANDKDEFEKEKTRTNIWNTRMVPFSSIQTLNAWVAARRVVNTDSRLIQASKCATLIVGPESCMRPESNLLPKHCTTKSLIRTEVNLHTIHLFGNFLKVTLVYALLLL